MHNEEENFRFVYSITNRTCKETIKDFLSKMLSEAPVPVNQIICVADNHSAHKSHMVRDYCNERGLELYFLPPMSSPLNPIEKVWSIFKRLFSKHIAGITVKIDLPALENHIRIVLELVE